jgi:hypothetical protein
MTDSINEPSPNIETNINETPFDASNGNLMEKSDKTDNSGKLYFIMIISIISFILLIILIIWKRLYLYSISLLRTYLFFYIRQFWFFAVIGVLFGSISIIKLIKDCINQFKLYVDYSRHPLHEPHVEKEYNDYYNNKSKNKSITLRKFYITYNKIIFALKAILYLLAILVLIVILMLSCFFMGHMLAWMDYFWILR